MEQHKVPFIYNFSPTVVPPPLDWYEWIRVSGYWFLDGADDSDSKKWEPPDGMLDFIERAHADGKKVVYIGFGSIVVSDPDAMTECVVQSVLDSDVRAILSKGWSDRLSVKKGDDEAADDEDDERTEEEKKEAEEEKKAKEEEKKKQEAKQFPPEIFSVSSVPHDWLFSRIDAACHHGGAGTTGASLRAGIPTIIKPFCGFLLSRELVFATSAGWLTPISLFACSRRSVLLGRSRRGPRRRLEHSQAQQGSPDGRTQDGDAGHQADRQGQASRRGDPGRGWCRQRHPVDLPRSCASCYASLKYAATLALTLLFPAPQEYAKSLIKHPDEVASSAASSPVSSPSTSVRELPSSAAAADQTQDGDASVVRSSPAKESSPGRAGDSDESWDVVPEGNHADSSAEQGTSGKHKHGGLGLVGTVIGGLTGGLTNGLGNKAKEKR